MHGVQNPDKGCGIATRGAARTFGEGLRRSTVAHFARKVRGGGEYCGGQARAKNPTKICPRALAILREFEIIF